MQTDPNSFTDKELKDSQDNPIIPKERTEEKETLNPIAPAEDAIDYQKKFSDSSREALKLLDEKKALEAELVEARKGSPVMDEVTGNLYPGFEELDPEAQQNLIRYTDMVTKRATAQINKDPAIAYARNQFNERKFDVALDSIISKYPDLDKSEFKQKYFKVNNVPDNIETILTDIAKIHLFDKAKDIGAKEEKTKIDRIDLERTTGGDKTPKASRALSDWQRMAQENPAKFASLSKEYNSDLESGKI